MDASLPPELAQAVRSAAAGREGLAGRSMQISNDYRDAMPSQSAVRGDDDAIAYALTRMPATFAAVSSVLGELSARAPGFAPHRLLDVGAGPGTASWAAREAFPDLAETTLADHNPAFVALARQLAAETPLGSAEFIAGDLGRLTLGDRRFDLVTLAYALTELPEAQVLPAVERLWGYCTGALVIVEPGRPREYQRLMQVRRHLFGLGARIVAPCPHERECPLVAPDWCHFSVRLQRSREHVQLKGGSLGYEDEKYSYLVVARPEVAATPVARIIKPPVESKAGVALEVCGPDGIETRGVPSRDRAAFKAARKLRWGDPGPA